MAPTELLRKAYGWGPLLFGIGFVAPVVAQLLETASIAPPFGLTTVQMGLVIGLMTGATAKRRGRWI